MDCGEYTTTSICKCGDFPSIHYTPTLSGYLHPLAVADLV